MENMKKRTSKDHNNPQAISFCDECKIYICKKCENMHSILFPIHNIYKIKNDINQIFTGICHQKNHSCRLKYFCKTHNTLCCAECITPIKDEENGEHNGCDICLVDEIKDNKKFKFNINIKKLELLSLNLNNSINELKIIFEKINVSKENLKLKVQKIFTKIRNKINEREDEILLKIDNKFDNYFFKENFAKEIEKLPNKIKKYLENAKKVEAEINNNTNRINSLINDDINIENDIKIINKIKNIIRQFKNLNLNANFTPDENNIHDFFNLIYNFGKIDFNNFKFVKYSGKRKLSMSRAYRVFGEDDNIITKIGTDKKWMGTICNYELGKSKEYIWKIKVLKSKNFNIKIGIASKGFDITKSMFNDCGWYYDLSDNSLCGENLMKNNKRKEKINSDEEESEEDSESKSDESSHSDKHKKIKKILKKKIKRIKRKKIESDDSEDDSAPDSESKSEISQKQKTKKIKDELENPENEEEDEILKEVLREIILVFDFDKKTLQFIEDNQVKGEHINIIKKKSLFPAIFLFDKNDTIAIEGFY